MHNKFKNKNGDFALNVVDDQLVSVLFPVNVFQPKLLQLVFDKFAKRATCEFFLIRLYFCCLLDQDLKGQCR